MREILFKYEMPPTTWVYVSALLIIGMFFKFNRFFSIRNLDLLALIVLSPALLLLYYDLKQLGYVWLFLVGGLFLVRLLVDPVMARRPLLEPNVNASALTFNGVAIWIFLMSNVVQGIEIMAVDAEPPGRARAEVRVPGFGPFLEFARLSRPSDAPNPVAPPEAVSGAQLAQAAARAAAVLAQLAVVLGMILIGYRHFGNIQTGMAAASLYLLLPYTAFLTARVDHVVPAALLVWAVAAYRRPVLSGALLGLAGGLVFYPLFLLPLWCSYYWQRGLIRFAVSAVGVFLVLVLALVLSADSLAAMGSRLQAMFGWTTLWLRGADGFWEYHEPAFRYPVLAGFVVLCGSLALWPPHKNLGTLLSCSTAVMLGAQFWHTHQGGLYMAWYLPLLVLTIFRPNLEDRVALSAVIERRSLWRRPATAPTPSLTPS